MGAGKYLIGVLEGVNTEKWKKAIFIKIMAENSPKLMKTRYPGIQTNKNLKQYVKKNPHLRVIKGKHLRQRKKEKANYLPRVSMAAVF